MNFKKIRLISLLLVFILLFTVGCTELPNLSDPDDTDVTTGNDETTGGNDETTGGNDETTGGNDETTGGNDETTSGDDETTGGNDETTDATTDARSLLASDPTLAAYPALASRVSAMFEIDEGLIS